MSLKVIGAGLGRTGTYSLKLALTDLGFGPCHHMEEVGKAMPVQVPLWQAALDGRPDWARIYNGFNSAVDWPTARFFRELHAAYPDARFILSQRSPQSWAESFGGTSRRKSLNRVELATSSRIKIIVQRVRARIEKVFGTWKRSYGLRRMRWRGLAKCRLQVYLTATAYNLRRTLTILAAA